MASTNRITPLSSLLPASVIDQTVFVVDADALGSHTNMKIAQHSTVQESCRFHCRSFFELKWLRLAVLLLGVANLRADLLPNNFWVNPTFEVGTNLDQPDGTLASWNRGGNATNICQISTNNFVSVGHSLAVVDSEGGDLYGEWYADVALGDRVTSGDTLDLQWYELYNLSGPEMRVSVLFLNGAGGIVGQSHFVTTGTTSAGWVSTVEDSTFTKRNASVSVPLGAVKMRCSLVSGGSGSVTGIMLIDDFSVARAAVPNLLFGNFWINPSFEQGTNLDLKTGSPENWFRGGNRTNFCQVTTNNFSSASHALALIDNTAGDFYGEWYADVALSGNASPGDTLNLQWFEMYSLTEPEMRLTVTFFDAADKNVGESHFVTSGTKSSGWKGTIANSTFTKRNGSVLVPPNASKMRCSLVSGGSGAVNGQIVIDDLSVARVTPVISGNLWDNSSFESGNNLNQPNGVPANWNRRGSEPSIAQVTTNNSASPSHALAVLDSNPNGSGEWYADVTLGDHAHTGDLLDVRWSQMHGITNGEMRVTVGFLSANGAVLTEKVFPVTGASPGWLGTIAGSPFVKVNQEVAVPAGATKIRVVLASGGPPETVGSLVLDDLTVAVHPPSVLTGNFFPNPTLEEGEQLDNPKGALPAGIWTRGGSDASIDQVSAENSVSATHALALIDNNTDGYGEWYGFFTLVGVNPGDSLDLQWFQLYSTTNGGMRLSLAFTDADNNQLANRDFNMSGQSPGWQGTIPNSSFEKQNQQLTVPEGAAKLRVNFASGGSSGVTGVALIDDLSVRISKLSITGVTLDSSGVTLSWNSAPDKTYTLEFGTVLGTWTQLVTGVPSAGLSTSYLDSVVHAGNAGFYRVIQE